MADNILSSSTFSKLPLSEQTKDATATAGNIFEGKTAYINGEKITGTMLDRNTVGKNNAVGINESYSNVASNPYDSNIQINTNLDGVKRINARVPAGYYNGSSYVGVSASLFGNAVTSNVLSGKTFTSENGLKLTGALSNFGSTTKASSTVAYDATNNVVQVSIPSSGYYNTSSKITITKDRIAALDGIGLTDPDSITTRYARGFATGGRHAVLPFTPTGVIGFITETSRMTSWIYYVIVDDYCYEPWQDGASSNGFHPYLELESSIDNTNKVYNKSRNGTLWYSAGII